MLPLLRPPATTILLRYYPTRSYNTTYYHTITSLTPHHPLRYPADAAKRKRIETVELKNGRLAMIGFASFFCGHFFPGTVPVMDMIGNH